MTQRILLTHAEPPPDFNHNDTPPTPCPIDHNIHLPTHTPCPRVPTMTLANYGTLTLHCLSLQLKHAGSPSAYSHILTKYGDQDGNALLNWDTQDDVCLTCLCRHFEQRYDSANGNTKKTFAKALNDLDELRSGKVDRGRMIVKALLTEWVSVHANGVVTCDARDVKAGTCGRRGGEEGGGSAISQRTGESTDGGERERVKDDGERYSTNDDEERDGAKDDGERDGGDRDGQMRTWSLWGLICVGIAITSGVVAVAGACFYYMKGAGGHGKGCGSPGRGGGKDGDRDGDLRQAVKPEPSRKKPTKDAVPPTRPFTRSMGKIE